MWYTSIIIISYHIHEFTYIRTLHTVKPNQVVCQQHSSRRIHAQCQQELHKRKISRTRKRLLASLDFLKICFQEFFRYTQSKTGSCRLSEAFCVHLLWANPAFIHVCLCGKRWNVKVCCWCQYVLFTFLSFYCHLTCQFTTLTLHVLYYACIRYLAR